MKDIKMKDIKMKDIKMKDIKKRLRLNKADTKQIIEGELMNCLGVTYTKDGEMPMCSLGIIKSKYISFKTIDELFRSITSVLKVSHTEDNTFFDITSRIKVCSNEIAIRNRRGVAKNIFMHPCTFKTLDAETIKLFDEFGFEFTLTKGVPISYVLLGYIGAKPIDRAIHLIKKGLSSKFIVAPTMLERNFTYIKITEGNYAIRN